MNTKATTPPGMAVQALAGEIIDALLADEKDGGYDLTAGLFGRAFSTLVRRWAAAEWGATASPARQAAGAAAVLYVSPEQLAKHTDLEGEGSAEAGRYLPARKTQGGKFTQPLYADVPAAVAVPIDNNLLGEIIGCFDAALAEGLMEALLNTRDARLADLVTRRLMHAYYAAIGPSISAPAQEHATQGGSHGSA